MKKACIIFLSAALAVVVLAAVSLYVLSRVLHSEDIRDRVLDLVARSMPGSTISCRTLSWQWYPLPHLRASGLVISQAEARLDVPELTFHPSLPGLLLRGAMNGVITLQRPRLVISDMKKWLATFYIKAPEHCRLKMTDAALEVTDPSYLSGILRPRTLRMDGLAATLILKGKKGDFRLRGKSPFAGDIRIDGDFSLENATCALRLRAKKFLAGRLFQAGEALPLAFTDRAADLDLRLGAGRGGWALDINTEQAGLILRGLQQQEPLPELLAGRLAASVKGNDHGVAATVHSLSSSWPRGRLQGTMQYLFAKGRKEPQWDIAVAALDLDVDAVRRTVLTLWPESEVGRTVCDIVRSGKARTASWRFRGKAGDLADIKAHRVQATAEKAAVHVPFVNLDLVEASGPIIIENGSLSGLGLKARMGRSAGWDARLLLDLTGKDPRFALDIELDADLLDLHPVLLAIVPHEGFRREAALFAPRQGRARGRLSIGDHLRDLRVAVDIRKATGSFGYQRLPWPVTVENLALTVLPGRVVWKNAAAGVGPHRIDKASGFYDWTKEPLLDIRQTSGSVDLQQLVEFMQKNPALAAQLPPQASAFKGEAGVTAARFSGDPATPSSWRYQIQVAGDALAGGVQGLPPGATLQGYSAGISDSALDFRGRLAALSQSLAVSGRFFRTNNGALKGAVVMDGVLLPPLARWLATENLVPGNFLPRAPCRVSRLRLDLDGGIKKASGTLQAELEGEKKPAFTFALAFPAPGAYTGEATFTAGAAKAVFSGNSRKGDALPRRLAVNGVFAAADLREIFPDLPLAAGSIAGNAEIRAEGNTATETFVATGSLKGQGLRWQGKKDEIFPAGIAGFSVSGNGNRLLVKELLLNTDNAAGVLSGELAVLSDRLHLDLDLKATRADWEGLARHFRRQNAAPAATVLGRRLDGRVRFQVGRLESGGKEKNATAGPAMVFTGVRGEASWQGERGMALRLVEAGVCGMHLKGLLYPLEKNRPGFLEVATRPDEEPSMELALPCLGMAGDLIEGGFSLRSRLEGGPGAWQNGTFTLRSEKGRILRLSFLSKVLSVINLTDILTLFSGPGLAYAPLEVTAKVQDNILVIDSAVLKGDGLNIFARGSIDLGDNSCDLVLLFAPLKTIDAIVSRIPFVGRAVGGKYGAVVTIPVAVKGPLADPQVEYLPAGEVGAGILNLIRDTLSMPLDILSPILSTPKIGAPPATGKDKGRR